MPTPAPTPAPTIAPSPGPTAIAPDTLFVDAIEVEGLDSAWEAVYSVDGSHVYLTGSDRVTILDVDPETGQPESTGSRSSPPAGLPASAFDGVAEIATSSDGQCVFVAAVGGTGSISSLSLDSESGNMTHVTTVSNNSDLLGAADLLVSPDGTHVYVPSIDCGCILMFTVGGASTCALAASPTVVASSLSAPRGMEFSPDGLSLYSTDSGSNSLLRFSRDSMTGDLTLLQTINDGDDVLT